MKNLRPTYGNVVTNLRPTYVNGRGDLRKSNIIIANKNTLFSNSSKEKELSTLTVNSKSSHNVLCAMILPVQGP